MITPEDKILVALSGGCDSVCLSVVLKKLGYSIGCAHLNHMIRDEAEKDQNFCKSFCEKNGFVFHTKSVNVPALAEENKTGLENQGREERYKFFDARNEYNALVRKYQAYNEELEEYNISLTTEEQNIIATYMIVEWLGQQLASVENVRMKYSGSDFKFTSQANHMQKLLSIKKDYEREGFHLQRLYKRRIADDKGIMQSTMNTIMEASFKEGGNTYYGFKQI